MSCCTNDLGLKPHNKDINTGLMAEQAGEYSFVLNFNGAKVVKKVTLGIGDDLIIPRPFNEDFIYSFQIIQPDGVAVIVDDCPDFIFKTYISIEECDQCECPPETDNYYS